MHTLLDAALATELDHARSDRRAGRRDGRSLPSALGSLRSRKRA